MYVMLKEKMQECIVNVSSIDQRFKFRRETLKPIFFKVTKENTLAIIGPNGEPVAASSCCLQISRSSNIVCPFCLGIVPPTKFSKGEGGLTEPQLLEGLLGKKW